MPLSVLFVRSDVKLAGPGRLMLSSAVSLQKAGFDVVFATSGGALVPEIENAGFKHITLPGLEIGKRSIMGMLRTAWALQRLVRKESIDVIHSFNAQAGLVSVPAAWLNRLKIFNTVLGNGREKMLRYMPFKLIAVSQSVSDKLQEFGVPADKIRIIYNSTLDDHFILPDRAAFDHLEKTRANITPFTFISVAMITGRKGHAEILDALAAYQARSDALPVRMLLVGDGPKRQEIEDYAAHLNLTDSVCFEGSSSQVARYLDRSHTFIHLSETETFGIVIAEANARGLPVIAANVGGIPEVLSDGVTGILVDRSDPNDVAAAMARLMNDRNLVSQFGWAGAERAPHLFSKDRMTQDLLSLYQNPWHASN